MASTDIWRGLEARRETVQRHATNVARRAVSLATYQTVGAGIFVESTVVPFQTSFIDEPTYSDAAALDGTDRDGDPQHYLDGWFPRCDALVSKWRQNAYGHYTGAWLIFSVEYIGERAGDDPLYVINHHLHFTGIGIKSLSPAQMEAL